MAPISRDPHPRRSGDTDHRPPSRMDVDVLHSYLLLTFAAVAVKRFEPRGESAGKLEDRGLGKCAVMKQFGKSQAVQGKGGRGKQRMPSASCELNFVATATELDARFRAFNPWGARVPLVELAT